MFEFHPHDCDNGLLLTILLCQKVSIQIITKLHTILHNWCPSIFFDTFPTYIFFHLLMCVLYIHNQRWWICGSIFSRSCIYWATFALYSRPPSLLRSVTPQKGFFFRVWVEKLRNPKVICYLHWIRCKYWYWKNTYYDPNLNWIKLFEKIIAWKLKYTM